MKTFIVTRKDSIDGVPEFQCNNLPEADEYIGTHGSYEDFNLNCIHEDNTVETIKLH